MGIIRGGISIGALKDVILGAVQEGPREFVKRGVIVVLERVASLVLKPVEGLLRTMRTIRIIPGETIPRFWATTMRSQ